MRKYQNSIIFLLLLLIGGLLFFINQKETEIPKGKRIIHFREAEIINPVQGPKFDSAWFNSEYQVIAYSQNLGDFSIITYDWDSYFKNNPEIEFIFYYSGKDRDELVEWIKENEFGKPVLYDPEKVFYNQNVTGETMSIVLNTKDGIVQFLENPSFSNYQEYLDRLKK
jgi:hypothetical protein